MIVSHERAKYLLKSYVDRSATKEELSELTEWLANGEVDEAFKEQIELLLKEPDQSWGEVDWNGLYEGIEQQMGAERSAAHLRVVRPVHRVHFLRRGFVRYAAAAVLIIGGATVLTMAYHHTHQDAAPAQGDASIAKDVDPGQNRAMLTLADGTVIDLDSATRGAIARQGNTAIVKLADGGIAYNLKGRATGDELLNTMRTPNGGQYQLTLPDGTRVWLNAASAITYPAAFSGTQRKVKISGEAYFEVAKDSRKPFIVELYESSSIEVLGTSFNVNAYADEGKIKATLLDGSVKVNARASDAVILKPAQQALISLAASPERLKPGSKAIVVASDVDIARVMAWKNGLFDLEGASMEELMRQIERWYDISVKYDGPIPDQTFHGKITRDLTLSQLLKGFEDMNIKFRLEGKVLVVTSK